VQQPGDAAGDRIQLDADEAHPLLPVTHEIPDAATGFQDGGVDWHAQAGNRLVDGSDDGRRRIEGVEGSALGAVEFGLGQEGFQLFAQGLPAGVLVAAGDGVGKNGQGNRAEAGEAGERLLLLRGGGPLPLLDSLDGADGGNDVACFALFAACDGNGWGESGVFGAGGRSIRRFNAIGGSGRGCLRPWCRWLR